MERHGMSYTPEYSAYRDAKLRCTRPNSPRYSWYGARGIEFKFESFMQFYEEVGPRPDETYSLDRIDNEGHYEPGNIRWATKSEQVKNRRAYNTPWLQNNDHNAKRFVITHPNGRKENIYNMAEFCRKNGLCTKALHKTIEGKYAKTHKGFKAECA